MEPADSRPPGRTEPRARWPVLTTLAVVAAAGACAGGGAGPARGTSGAGLYYEVTGAGDAVVLVHGFSLDHRMWDAQVGPLGQRHRVIRYDLRGHGRSAAIAGPYAGRDDLRDLLDELGVPAATLVGLSAGAQVAVDFALEHPHRVTRLVLAGPGLGGYVPRDPFDWMAPVMAAARAGDTAGAAARWAETKLMAMPSQPAADSLMRVMVLDNQGLWALAANPERPLDPPAIRRLHEVRAPTLVVVGQDDLADVHRTADTLLAGVAGSRKIVVADAGHLVNMAAPAAFNRAVLDFLATSARAAAPAGARAAADVQRAFLRRYAAYCGRGYAGRSVLVDLGDDHPLDGAELRMIPVRCTDDEVRVRFHVDADTSRTWILTHTADGLRLAHDHRHDDGTEHEANLYGGFADGRGSPTLQYFPADARTIADRAAREVNVWAKEFDLEGDRYFYRLYLRGELRYEAEFDLGRPLPTRGQE